MSRMKRVALFLALFSLIFTQLAFAQGFSVSTGDIKDVLAGQSQTFTVSVTNNGAEDWFSIAVIGTESSWVSTDVFSARIKTGETAAFKATIAPPKDALPQTYAYSVVATRNLDKATEKKEIRIPVVQLETAVLRNYEISCTTCKPGGKLSISVDASNTGTKALENAAVEVEFGSQKKSVPLKSLSVLESQAVSIDFPLDKYFAPGKYELKTSLKSGEKTYYALSSNVGVESVSKIVYDKKASQSLFGLDVVLSAENQGNVKENAELKSAVGENWYSFFSGPDPTRKSSEGYVWSIPLSPGEKMQIRYSEIYWITIALIFLIILGGIVAYLQMNAVTIRKRIAQKHVAAEGREFPVLLHVRNRGLNLDNVVVRDFVPSLFTVTEKFDTVKPVIKKTHDGIELTWRLGKLKQHEERVLSYKIKALVGIIGSATLPQAEVKFKFKDKVQVKKSNEPTLIGTK